MKGYLGEPEKTHKVLQEGWYETGDIAKLDEDGFITITGRLSLDSARSVAKWCPTKPSNRF